MLRRFFDIAFSLFVLVLFSPIICVLAILIFFQDRHSPFYVSSRIGKNARPFMMLKFRSMMIGADKALIDTTIESDSRITKLGAFIRRYKLDELPQFFNILMGDMSIVGPRPNVEREVRFYNHLEGRLLSVKPGLTDFSSIVFSDLGRLLKDCGDPNIAYRTLVRPWKSRLGLLYIQHQSLWLDLKLIGITILALGSQAKARILLSKLLTDLGADSNLLEIVRRDRELYPCAPPE